MSDDVLIEDNGDIATRVYHSPDTVELARELWTYVCGRNAKAVSLQLQSDHGLVVTHDVIKKWAIRHRWDDRATADVIAIIPHIRQDVASELILASREAKQVIRSTLQRYQDGEDLGKSDDIAAKIAFGVLDRVGFGPQRQEGSGSSSDARAIPATSSGKIDPAARRRLARQLGEMGEEE